MGTNVRKSTPCSPVLGNCPISMFWFSSMLISGSMCVRQVARMTPPPRHESAEMKRDVFEPFPWFLITKRLKQSGARPTRSETPPSRIMAVIFAQSTSIFAIAQRCFFWWGERILTESVCLACLGNVRFESATASQSSTRYKSVSTLLSPSHGDRGSQEDTIVIHVYASNYLLILLSRLTSLFSFRANLQARFPSFSSMTHYFNPLDSQHFNTIE